jgi:hypothetical protein
MLVAGALLVLVPIGIGVLVIANVRHMRRGQDPEGPQGAG